MWQEACSPCCSADTRKGRGVDANVAESKGLSLMPLITKTMVPAAEARQGKQTVKVTSYEEGSTPEDESLLAFLKGFHLPLEMHLTRIRPQGKGETKAEGPFSYLPLCR
ncbi:hypothetical protein PVK06_015244 [Gossypium arboreum]|uniref:Uncharacterized protein n=1 Tax=Gossypium arboreum TaxID=29729 RepID=A0ABR0PWS5_GOSAR|nr:hypothetical protein PVK06_015244 [Gossypium arboreum]